MRQMKDSGVKWIGEVPEGWEILPVNYCFQEVVNLNTNLEENNALQFKMGEIISKKEGNSKYTPETLEGYNIVEPGDIMINGLNLSFDLISQRVAMVRDNGVITSTYLAIRPKDNTKSSYAQYLLKAYDNAKALHGMGRGLRATLAYNYFRREPFILPPLPEQRAIAAYLDEKCGEIDRCVRVQEEMIEELKAYKQSIITEAVTKGLDPDAKLKPSGIEWIGEIPEGWEVKSLKYVFDFLDYLREPISAEKRERNNPIYDYYGASGVIDKIDYYNVDDTVLLIGEDGANLVMRNLPLIYKASGKFWVNNHTHILKPQCDDYNYLAFLMEAADYTDYITGSAQPKLGQSKLSAVPLCIPPLSTQRSIAAYLDAKTSEIDSLIALKQQKITYLKEYKKSLIYECVTGKKEINK